MKIKSFFAIFALLMSAVCANAFEFDGIDLNMSYAKVTREIATRGYVYNHERNCLQGDCQGMKIYLSINYLDVKEPGMLGQLIIDIPIDGDKAETLKLVTNIFNVVYHQVNNIDGVPTYLVDKDGTELTIGTKDGFVELIYNTPYYLKREVK